jgi:hypothetical protein
MTKRANGFNGRKLAAGVIAAILLTGTGTIGMFARMERIDDRQTNARIRNLESIAVNAAILARHGERLSSLEESKRNVQTVLLRLEKKLDILVAATHTE